MISSTRPSPLQAQAAVLARKTSEGKPPDAAELNQVAKALNVDVETLQQALTQSLSAGTDQAELAGTTSAQLRKNTQGLGQGYANEKSVDLKGSSALQGHGLQVDAGAAASISNKQTSTLKTQKVAQVLAKQELGAVPTVADIESLRVGDMAVGTFTGKLKAALLSNNPQVVRKASSTLQTVESYQRKAKEDATNYAGTGFFQMKFPSVKMNFTAAETKKLIGNLVMSKDPNAAGVMMMASRTGLLRTEPQNVLNDHQKLSEMWPAGKSAKLAGSDGAEESTHASFAEEWKLDVEPGKANIEDVIRDVQASRTKGTGGVCPFAQGNHAKGKSFDDGVFQVNDSAPTWIKELTGTEPKEGAMMRLSTSASNPDDHDKESAQTGMRLVIPIKGKPGEPKAQTLDITCNTGSSTHRPNAREHTAFTEHFSKPKSGPLGWKPVRIASYLAGGVANWNLLDRAKGIPAAIKPTKEAMSKPLDEQDLYARHTLFIGGRYVQVRYDVVKPTDFRVPDKSEKDGQLESRDEAISRGGIKINIYMVELPPKEEWPPGVNLIEEEGWIADAALGKKEFLYGTTEFKPQTSDPESDASEFFKTHSHMGGLEEMTARGVGTIGRHRPPIYWESLSLRLQEMGGDKYEKMAAKVDAVTDG